MWRSSPALTSATADRNVASSIVKAPAPADVAIERRRRQPLPEWSDSPPAGNAHWGVPWTRYLSALRRYKWSTLAIILAGTALGVAATRFLNPEYEVPATIWISTAEGTRRDERGPIRAEELLSSTAWVELFHSFAVVDAVVKKMSLFLAPADAGDSEVFAGFTVAQRFTPGRYTLTLDPPRWSYVLTSADEIEIERGAIGDSIGRSIGFLWAPTAASLGQRSTVTFDVVNPRDVSVALRDRLTPVLPERSNFLRVSLSGTDPGRTAAILNAWIEQFVSTAAELKKRNLVELTKVLDAQLGVAKDGLQRAENALETFRVRAITLPSEGGSAGGGTEVARDPVMENYFRQKTEHDNIRSDRQALENLVAQVQRGTLPPDALLSLPSTLDGAENLRVAVTELGAKQTQLVAARQLFTDEHQRVRDLRQAVEVLERQTIPRIAAGLVDQLRRREDDLGTRIQRASQDLRNVPSRTIDELRLRRELTSAENLYTTLQTRYEEARLAEASAVPDVSILDAAVPPQWPSKDRAPIIVFTAFLASLGAAAGLALLRDRTDQRFRYPEQAANELGLDIIGTVPPIKATVGAADPVEAAQLTEAFRSIRVRVQQAIDTAGPMLLTISSPGVGDGKSLVSSNLALSFADAGFRTVLIDGDIRRGELHSKFGVPSRPGLLDYLAGDASIKDALHGSSSRTLSIIPHGTKRERGPELLASEGMAHLIATLEAEYDAIIVDSPPLGANIDPFALGTTTGNMLLVLRSGETDRRVAETKVKTLEHFPIHVLGVVLNDFDLEGPYQQYPYLYGYGALVDDDWTPQRSTRTGQLARSVEAEPRRRSDPTADA